MAVSAARVSVTTTATALNAASSYPQRLLLKNSATNIVNLGTTTVSTANGYQLAADGLLAVELQPGEVLYGIAGTTQVVEVLRSGS